MASIGRMIDGRGDAFCAAAAASVYIYVYVLWLKVSLDTFFVALAPHRNLIYEEALLTNRLQQRANCTLPREIQSVFVG